MTPMGLICLPPSSGPEDSGIVCWGGAQTEEWLQPPLDFGHSVSQLWPRNLLPDPEIYRGKTWCVLKGLCR